MPIQLFRLLLLFLLAGWQFAWAESAPDTATPAITVPVQAKPDPAEILRQMQAAPPRGLFYKISKNGRTAYLFGTIHVGKADFYPLDMATMQALVQSSELVVELDATQTDKMKAAIQHYAMLPAPQTLDAILPPELGKRLQTQFDILGVPRETVQSWKPWMATLALVMGAMQKSGFDPGYATDIYLIMLGKGLNKPVTELESIDYQLQLFDTLSHQEQLDFLSESLATLETGQQQGDTQVLIEAWLNNDAEKLHQLSLKSFRDNPRTARWMKQKLFTERNQHMAEKIDRMLTEGHTPFVAVGALHLTGKDGLPALLEKRGYRVTNLYP